MGPSQSIEPSTELLNLIVQYIKDHQSAVDVSSLIDAIMGNFPETYQRDDVEYFVFKALESLVEANQIGFIIIADQMFLFCSPSPKS